MLSELKTKSKVVGVKQSLKAVRNGQSSCVCFAADADPALLEPLRALCSSAGIRMVEAGSMAELGSACGIDVGAAVVALLKEDPPHC